MEIEEAQRHIGALYGARDLKRGTRDTFLWLVEEVGELSEVLRKEHTAGLREELSDVLAWLLSLSNVLGIDLGEAFSAKYGSVCPRCMQAPCSCSEVE